MGARFLFAGHKKCRAGPQVQKLVGELSGTIRGPTCPLRVGGRAVFFQGRHPMAQIRGPPISKGLEQTT